MTKVIVHTYTTIHGYRRQINLALLAVCAMMVLVYAFNLYRVISHTIALQQVGTQTATIDAAINTLDTQYIALSHSITPDSIKTHGLDQAPVSTFISRTTSLGRIALSGHEL